VTARLAAGSIGAVVEGSAPGAAFDQQVVVYSATALFILLAQVLHAYRTERILEPAGSIGRLLMTLGATFAYLVVVGVATKTSQSHSRIWFFSRVSLSVALLPALRFALLAHLHGRLEKGSFVYRALSVGLFADPPDANAVKEFSARKTQVVGQLRMRDIAELERLAHPIAVEEIDQIYIVAPWADVPRNPAPTDAASAIFDRDLHPAG
jgi:hypothetical protein